MPRCCRTTLYSLALLMYKLAIVGSCYYVSVGQQHRFQELNSTIKQRPQVSITQHEACVPNAGNIQLESRATYCDNAPYI